MLKQQKIMRDECHETTLQTAKNMLIMTRNFCPCYIETLKLYKPRAVLGSWDNTLENGIAQVQKGKKYLSLIPYQSPLTPKERQVLRYNAVGLDAIQIGQKLGCGETTVQTHIKHIYSKLRLTFGFLELENNRQLLLYWCGDWHLIIKKELPVFEYLKSGTRKLEDFYRLLENPNKG